MERDPKFIEVNQRSRNLFTGRKSDGDSRWLWLRERFAQKYIDKVRHGIEHAALQLHGVVFRGYVRQISCDGMAAGALPIAVKERGSFPRIARNYIADLVSE